MRHSLALCKHTRDLPVDLTNVRVFALQTTLSILTRRQLPARASDGACLREAGAGTHAPRARPGQVQGRAEGLRVPRHSPRDTGPGARDRLPTLLRHRTPAGLGRRAGRSCPNARPATRPPPPHTHTAPWPPASCPPPRGAPTGPPAPPSPPTPLPLQGRSGGPQPPSRRRNVTRAKTLAKCLSLTSTLIMTCVNEVN